MVDKYTVPKHPIKAPGDKGLFTPKLQGFPSGNDAEHRNTIVDEPVKKMQEENIQRRNDNRSLINDAFPSMGSAQPSYLGSQSDTPDKGD